MANAHRELKHVCVKGHWMFEWVVWFESELQHAERKKRNLKRKKTRLIQRKQRITDKNFKKHGYTSICKPPRETVVPISQKTRWKQSQKHKWKAPSSNPPKRRRRSIHRSH